MTNFKRRHRWDFTPKNKTIDAGVSQCKNCKCVREFIAGKPSYFINDCAYPKAPNCNPS